MARVKLSEFRAKNLVYRALGLEYAGLEVDLASKGYEKTVNGLPASGLYVAKVDQAVKKRNKSGLVTLKRTKQQVLADLRDFKKQGYHYALVEPFVPHSQGDEHYIALQRTESGIRLSYSSKGGVDIESQSASLQHSNLSEDGYKAAQNETDLDSKFVASLYELFQNAHMTLLEINPCVLKGSKVVPLDAAVEVDSAASFFVEGAWSETDIRQANTRQSSQEQIVETLNAQSPASFSLKVLNSNGSLFLLLSGGGASVVIADELSHLGSHGDIANYGEYSGNPSEDETYVYAGAVLQLLFASKAPKKQLIIAGGVANFTDVAKTFAGIMRAIQEVAGKMRAQNVSVLVRRGGPNQVKGLKAMESFLESKGIAYKVYGPETSLAQAVAESTKGL